MEQRKQQQQQQQDHNALPSNPEGQLKFHPDTGAGPESEGGGMGPGPLGLREEAGAWTPGSEGGGWGLDPWV
jgi:hypothetical protein